MRGFLAIVRRELQLAFRRGGDAVLALGFFVVAVALFPLAIGPERALLASIAAGLIWVTAMLAATVSVERLFRADLEDGTLELLALKPLPLELVVLAKVLAHWLSSGLAVLLLTPLLAIMLHLPEPALPPLLAGLALGTPVLSLIGALGAALVLGARRGGALIGLIVLPLFLPVLIFGVSAVEAALSGLPVAPHLMILGALLLVALPVGVFGAAAALRPALE